MENSIELFQRSSLTITSKLFLWSFHNTASIIFWSFPFLPCAYEPFPPIPSLCKGGGKQDLVWKVDMLRSSRLVQASQSLCSFPTPSAVQIEQQRQYLKQDEHTSKQFLSAQRERNPRRVQHTFPAACLFHGSLRWSGACQTLYELLGFKMGSSPASCTSCKRASARAPLMSSEDMNAGDIYRSCIILSSLPVPLCKRRVYVWNSSPYTSQDHCKQMPTKPSL